ncbi:MAG: hypothetical protein V4494_01665 [Chlamydiota bacterium]
MSAANFPSIEFPFSGVPNPSQIIPMSPEEVQEEIRSITAEEIEFIGVEISQSILNKLGPAAENKSLFSEQEVASLSLHTLNAITDDLEEAFAIPLNFFEQGIRFAIFIEGKPQGFFDESLKKCGINLEGRAVPQQYFADLSWHQGLTHESRSIVLNLTEQIDGSDFPETIIAVENLQENFQQELEKFLKNM